MPKTVCIDFDGVLASQDGRTTENQGIGNPQAPAIRLVRILKAKGFKIVILTARVKHAPVKAWLTKHKIPFEEVTNVKPPAVAYVDDRAVSWKDDTTSALVQILSLEKI